MKKIKTVFITGSRAEYGLLYPVLKTFKISPEFDFKLVITGSHLSPFFGLTKNDIINDGFNIDYEVPFHLDSDLDEAFPISLGNGIIQFTHVFKILKPDIVFVLGDRIEVLSAALSANFLMIPLAHIHGGDNTSFMLPDTYIRHCISKLAHIHFPATKNSKKNLIKMGEDKRRIFVVGNLGIYSLDFKEIPDYKILKNKYNLFKEKEYALLIHHPFPFEKEKSLEELEFILKALFKFSLPFVAISPNNDPGGREMRNFLFSEAQRGNFILIDNLPYREFISLMKNAKFMIGNSSSALYEACLFKIPVITVGRRTELRERGGYIYNALKSEEIEDSIEKILKGKLPKFIPSPFKRIRGDLIIKKVIINFFKNYTKEEIFNKKLNIE
ncbi:MAG: UDP-N-acetylglucosamine 2-epimerase [candidate division WOR-3 bacterium]